MLLKNILFLDIETVTQKKCYSHLNPRTRSLWEKKINYLSTLNINKTPQELYKEKGAIYSEFGRIIIIGLGYFSEDDVFKVFALYNEDEKKLLTSFKKLLETKFSKIQKLCAHNGKEFDFPYLCRRMIVKEICIPKILDSRNKKPWEIENIDTMELWKFGDRKSFTSLDLLASIFNIPSSKDVIDGSMVHEYFYEKNAIEELKEYCIKDVVTLMQVFLKLNYVNCSKVKILKKNVIRLFENFNLTN